MAEKTKPAQTGAQPAAAGTNGLAIASLITGLLGLNILAIIFGFVALSQIKQTGQGGQGMAIAGIILGFATLAIGIIILIWVFVFVGAVTQEVIQHAPSPTEFETLFEELNAVEGTFNVTVR